MRIAYELTRWGAIVLLVSAGLFAMAQDAYDTASQDTIRPADTSGPNDDDKAGVEFRELRLHQ